MLANENIFSLSHFFQTTKIILGSGPSSRRGSLFSGDDSRRPSLLINDEVSITLTYTYYSHVSKKKN